MEDFDFIAIIAWFTTPEGRGIGVRASGSGDLGVAAIALCQTMMNLPDFGAEVQAKARALIEALGKGREIHLPEFHVVRRTGEPH